MKQHNTQILVSWDEVTRLVEMLDERARWEAGETATQEQGAPSWELAETATQLRQLPILPTVQPEQTGWEAPEWLGRALGGLALGASLGLNVAQALGWL